jgi:hypothetical protein
MARFVKRFLWVVPAAVVGLARADDAPKKPNYKDDVASILNAKCNACHNQDKKKGGLVLDGYAALMQGGASGAVVEPGDPDNSRLYLLVAHEEEPKMPPNAERIPDAELDTIRNWIEAGAPETSGSVVAVKEKPKIDFKLDAAAIGKPQGEPAMPHGILTEPVVTSARPNAITALAHSPWAPVVAIAGHKQVVLYHSKTLRLLGVLPFPEGIVEVLRFTLDGELLLAGGGRGGQSGRVVVWDVKTGERVFEVGKEYDTVLAADMSPDRSLVALGGPSKVLRVYNTSDGELAYECKKHTDWVTSVAFSPDGVLLASGDRNGGLLVWESANGREFHDLRNHTAMITGVSWRLDANVLASSSEDASIRLWEMENGGNVKGWGAHGGGAEWVSFAKDGRLVSAGRDRLAKIWDQNGGQQRQLEALPDVAMKVVFTDDEQAVVAGDYSGEVRICELKEGKLMGRLAANPASVGVRLEAAGTKLAQLVAARDGLARELADLQERAATQASAEAEVMKGLHVAQRDADEAAGALAAAEGVLSQAQTDEASALTSASAADELRMGAVRQRDQALEEVRAREQALRDAETAAAATQAERERHVVSQAREALTREVDSLAAKLPAWLAAIAAARSAQAACDRTTTARIEAWTRSLPLRARAVDCQSALVSAQSAVHTSTQSRNAAEQAVAAKRGQVEAVAAEIGALESERDDLVAQRRVLDTKASNAQAAATVPARVGS